ncbi:PP2C family protein-serine/threonine phosphatase [Nocardioides panacihumi]|uniref:PP2C family protein-serine/threonine phosphatase n=1 Tax=Nocardioides panacihumi TaxID=400774 RepID=A0ABN2QE22_9ACTN
MLTDPARRSAAPAPDLGWDSAPSPALHVGADGVLVAVNAAARAILHSAAPGRHVDDCAPDWLAQAHRDRADEKADGAEHAGRVDDRTFLAQPVGFPDGGVMWWLIETTDVSMLREDLRAERERADFLRIASDELLTSLNVARTMEVATELAAGRLADAAWIIEPDVRGRHTAVVCVRGERPRRVMLDVRAQELPGLVEALQGFPPVPSRWIDPRLAPAWVVPDGFGSMGSVVVTALPGHGVPAGALILLRTTEQRVFSEPEEAVARLFAARVGAALSAARLFEEQSSITDILTAQLLPPALERADGVDFAGIYRPAQDTSRLGGDFYDVHRLGGGESLALLGDVCGKGLEAAVLAGKIRNTLQALLPMADDHRHMLELLNSSLRSAHETRFATLVLASTARVGDTVRVRLTRAGHLPPLVVRGDGRVEEVLGKGSLIGVLPAIETSTHTIDLAPGETCLLYTDGIIEAVGGPLGGEMFGEDRLRRALTECAGMPAEALVAHVLMLATDWLGGAAHDDMAVLAITAPTGPQPHGAGTDGATPAR